MPYTKTAWETTTRITHDLLNKQETGIETAQATADSALSAASGSGGAVVVAHGTDAARARPAVTGPVVWVGTAVPTNLNAASGDVHVDPSKTGLDAEGVRDVMGATLIPGPNVTITENDIGDTLAIAASGGGTDSSLFARKTADTSRLDNNDADDPQLTLSAAANTTYLVNGFLRYEAATTGDLKVRVLGPGDATAQVMYMGPQLAATGTTGSVNMAVDQFSRTLGGAGAGNDMGVILHGTISVVTAGAVRISWAQGATDVVPTILFAGSWLRLTPVA